MATTVPRASWSTSVAFDDEGGSEHGSVMIVSFLSVARAIDLGLQRVELVVGPRLLAQQGGDEALARAVEEDAEILLQRGALRGGRRRGGRVDVAQPLLVVAQPAFLLEPHQHGADGGVARGIGEPGADLLGGGAVAEGEDGVHDLALAARELLGAWSSDGHHATRAAHYC
jgi:hypothetical protein